MGRACCRQCFVVAVVSILVLTIGMGSNGHAAQAVQELIARAGQILETVSSYPDALDQVIPLYRAAVAANPDDALPHRRLAWACLELGDLVEQGRTAWHRCGREAAEQALELDEANADAHFLFAATTGLLAEQRPMWLVSPRTPLVLEKHLFRALALEPDHARALNMMGMLLNTVPGPLRLLMKGTIEQAEGYLVRAVEASPASTRVRILLAEYYHSVGKPALAADHAQLIIDAVDPLEPWLWRNRHKPDAQALLRMLALN